MKLIKSDSKNVYTDRKDFYFELLNYNISQYHCIFDQINAALVHLSHRPQTFEM